MVDTIERNITDNLIIPARDYKDNSDKYHSWDKLFIFIKCNDDIFCQNNFENFATLYHKYLSDFGMTRRKNSGLTQNFLVELLFDKKINVCIKEYLKGASLKPYLNLWKALYEYLANLKINQNVSCTDTMISKLIMGLGGYHLATDSMITWTLKNQPGLIYFGLNKLIEMLNKKDLDYFKVSDEKSKLQIPAPRILDMALVNAPNYEGWLHEEFNKALFKVSGQK